MANVKVNLQIESCAETRVPDRVLTYTQVQMSKEPNV